MKITKKILLTTILATLFASCGKTTAQNEKVVSADPTKFTCLKTLEGHEGDVNSVAYSPDGTKIISGSKDETVKIWDANTGECLKTLEGHSSNVRSVAFSPDGKRIISGSDDKTVKIWGEE